MDNPKVYEKGGQSTGLEGIYMVAVGVWKNKENFKALSTFLTTVGIILLIWYLRFVEVAVPIYILFAGVILMAAGNVVAFQTVREKSSNLHFMFVLFLTTFVLSNLYDIRFNTMQGSDVLYEYTTARTTYEQGVWSLQRATWDNYFSAISISLIPVMVSKVTGLDLFLTFQLGMRLAAAILPLAIFLTVKEIFENVKLAALSSIIFSQLYFSFVLLPSVMRQYIAMISLVLAIFTLTKLLKRRSSNVLAWTILFLIFLFGVAAYHYTVAYWSGLIFLCVFLLDFFVPSFPRRVLEIIKGPGLTTKKRVMPAVYLLCFMILFFSWTTLVNLNFFLMILRNQVYLLSGGEPLGATGKYQVSWLTGSPAGPLATAWFVMEAMLAVLGFFYFILRQPKKRGHLPWVTGALVMFIALAIWVSPAFTAGLIYPDRVYILGSIFFTTFSAVVLLRANRKIKFVILLFLLINLPINMLLSSHQRYVLYHKETEVDPSIALMQNNIRESSFVLSEWLDTHVSISTVIYADTPTGVRSLFFSHHPIFSSAFTPLNSSSLFTSQGETMLFMFHYYNLHYGLWQSEERLVENFSVDNAMNQGSIVYNNGEASLVAFTDTDG